MFVTWRDYREVVHRVLFLTKNILLMGSTGYANPREVTVFLSGECGVCIPEGGRGGESELILTRRMWVCIPERSIGIS